MKTFETITLRSDRILPGSVKAAWPPGVSVQELHTH